MSHHPQSHFHNTCYCMFNISTYIFPIIILLSSLPPAYSLHCLSFFDTVSVCPPTFLSTQFYMRPHAHGPHPPHHLYAACMLTAPHELCPLHTVSIIITVELTTKPHHNILPTKHSNATHRALNHSYCLTLLLSLTIHIPTCSLIPSQHTQH